MIAALYSLHRFNEKVKFTQLANIDYYYPYRAFGGQNTIVYSTRFVTRRAIFFLNIAWAIFFNIARTLCDQSFNIGLRLRYVVRIHSSENRAMPRPP